jgi:uncharacterized RDD family membrane protein YckC
MSSPDSYLAGPPPVTPNLGELASWGQRVGAYLLDLVIIFMLTIPAIVVSLIVGAVSDALGAILFVISYVFAIFLSFYIQYRQGLHGATPAKRIMGMQVLVEKTGQTMGGGMGIVRVFAHYLDAIPCYIGYLFPLWDKKRQTLADKVMGTVVVPGPKLSFGDAVRELLPNKA